MRQIIFFAGFLFLINQISFSQQVTFHYDQSYPLNFKKRVPIGFKVVLDKKDTLKTKGFLNGNLSWKKLDIAVSGGYIKNGYLFIDDFDQFNKDYQLVFEVTYKNKNLKETIKCYLNFKGVEVADYRPEKGKDARNRLGRFFSSMFFKSICFDGKDGRNGENGKDGPYLHVVPELIEINSQRILAVHIDSQENGKARIYYINTQEGELRILADGSDGGKGGKGGPGEESEDCGGAGGRGGNGGNGGKGGVVEILVDEQSKPYLDRIIISNKGGRGGDFGRGGIDGSSFYDPYAGLNDGKQGEKGSDGLDGPEIIILKKED